MSTTLNKNRLEFEELSNPCDIKVSKVIKSNNGDLIRAIVTSESSIILTSYGECDGDVIIINGDPEVIANIIDTLGGFWAKGKALLRKGKSVVETVLGDNDDDNGGGDDNGDVSGDGNVSGDNNKNKECTQTGGTVNITLNGSGNIDSLNVNITCH